MDATLATQDGDNLNGDDLNGDGPLSTDDFEELVLEVQAAFDPLQRLEYFVQCCAKYKSRLEWDANSPHRWALFDTKFSAQVLQAVDSDVALWLSNQYTEKQAAKKRGVTERMGRRARRRGDAVAPTEEVVEDEEEGSERQPKPDVLIRLGTLERGAWRLRPYQMVRDLGLSALAGPFFRELHILIDSLPEDGQTAKSAAWHTTVLAIHRSAAERRQNPGRGTSKTKEFESGDVKRAREQVFRDLAPMHASQPESSNTARKRLPTHPTLPVDGHDSEYEEDATGTGKVDVDAEDNSAGVGGVTQIQDATGRARKRRRVDKGSASDDPSDRAEQHAEQIDKYQSGGEEMQDYHDDNVPFDGYDSDNSVGDNAAVMPVSPPAVTASPKPKQSKTRRLTASSPFVFYRRGQPHSQHTTQDKGPWTLQREDERHDPEMSQTEITQSGGDEAKHDNRTDIVDNRAEEGEPTGAGAIHSGGGHGGKPEGAEVGTTTMHSTAEQAAGLESHIGDETSDAPDDSVFPSIERPRRHNDLIMEDLPSPTLARFESPNDSSDAILLGSTASPELHLDNSGLNFSTDATPSVGKLARFPDSPMTGKNHDNTSNSLHNSATCRHSAFTMLNSPRPPTDIKPPEADRTDHSEQNEPAPNPTQCTSKPVLSPMHGFPPHKSGAEFQSVVAIHREVARMLAVPTGVQIVPQPDREGSLSTLRPGQWLSATAVKAAIDAFNPDTSRHTIFESPYLDFENIADNDAKGQRCQARCTQNHLYFLINVRDFHWKLAHLERGKAQLEMYDPSPRLARQSDSEAHQTAVERFAQQLAPTWSAIAPPSLHQNNSHDCGIYVATRAVMKMHGKECPAHIVPEVWRRAFALCISSSPKSQVFPELSPAWVIDRLTRAFGLEGHNCAVRATATPKDIAEYVKLAKYLRVVHQEATNIAELYRQVGQLDTLPGAQTMLQFYVDSRARLPVNIVHPMFQAEDRSLAQKIKDLETEVKKLQEIQACQHELDRDVELYDAEATKWEETASEMFDVISRRIAREQQEMEQMRIAMFGHSKLTQAADG